MSDATFAEIFKDIPAAPNTEVEQSRHAELMERMESQNYTSEDEKESNRLFYVIYPQFRKA